MKNMIDYLESKLGKGIKIYKYDDKIKTIGDVEIVFFEGEKYIIQIEEDKNILNIKGYCYLLHIKEYKYKEISTILENLFCDFAINILEKYIILSFKDEQNISEETVNILEAEAYSNTRIVYMGMIKNKNDFDEKFTTCKEILKFEKRIKMSKKYLNIRDYIGYRIIDMVNENHLIDTIFSLRSIDNLDINTIETGIAFIENNLNIAKTSNNLYIHRNTLIYRLDKIKEVLNMDIRNFEEAYYFYIGAKAYLNNKK